MNVLNVSSLIIEAVVATLGFWIALGKKQAYGLFIALTFTIYVIYDLSRFANFSLPWHDELFLIASISIGLAVLILLIEKQSPPPPTA